MKTDLLTIHVDHRVTARGLFSKISIHLPAALLRAAAMLALLVPAAAFVAPAYVAAAPLSAAGACATGVGNAGGEGIICQLTIVNDITSTGGSATVTVHDCLGSAGDPTDAARGHQCRTTTTSLSKPVTSVTQCDGSANGGGAVLRCSVTITNNFIGVNPGSSAVTVNQCVGSGDGITTGCDPFPATPVDAAITQCNGSANGGHLVGMDCIASGTMASALVITINQCNGSGSGGGGLIDCSASMTNQVVTGSTPSAATSAFPSASTSALPSASTGTRPSPSHSHSVPAPSAMSDTATGSGDSDGGPTLLVLLGLVLLIGGVGYMAIRHSRPATK